jgi:soluble lytic murein transglycosylase
MLLCCCLMANAGDIHSKQAIQAPLVPTTSNGLAQQQQLYTEALELARRGKWQQLKKQREQLKNYPLYPYLIYLDLASNLRYARHPQVRQYLQDYAGTVKAKHLRNRWLDYLAKRQYWTTYISFYEPQQASTAQQCQFQLARYYADTKEPLLTQRREQALTAALELWNVGKSQPKQCDRLFARLIADERITEALAWQRFNKALLNHQYQLARYLQRFFNSPHYSELAKLYYQADRSPQSIKQFAAFNSDSPEELDIIQHALVHLARRDSHASLRYWSHYQQTHEFTHTARSAIVSAIIKGLYKQGATAVADSYFSDHLQLLNETLDGSLVEWRIRLALAEKDWPNVALWLQRLPETLQSRSAWRYWTIRSMLSNPLTTEHPALQQMTESLAQERDFYGFLASDMLDKEYRINHRPVAIDPQRLAAVRALPEMARARELKFHNDNLDANREWHQASADFSYSDLLAAAIVTEQWQWHSKAIASLGRAQYWDDVELRFPLAFADAITAAAQSNQLDSHLLFALARQESAFDASATSPAGARGLMQLMPATAKSTARKYKIPYRKSAELYNPETNIAIASRYYSELLKRFDGSRILASAAYNAGPTRVAQWLNKSDGKLPFDIWIEVIPYTETRAYVRNILMYSIIYSRNMGQRPPLLMQNEIYRLL